MQECPTWLELEQMRDLLLTDCSQSLEEALPD